MSAFTIAIVLEFSHTPLLLLRLSDNLLPHELSRVGTRVVDLLHWALIDPRRKQSPRRNVLPLRRPLSYRDLSPLRWLRGRLIKALGVSESPPSASLNYNVEMYGLVCFAIVC